MHKLGLVLLLLISDVVPGRAQEFLPDYQRFLKKHQPRKAWAKQARRAELQLLETVFAAHQQKTGRRLDVADTLYMLTTTPAEVGRAAPNAGMIWNASDTLSFRLQYVAQLPIDPAAISYDEPFLAPSLAHDPYADIGYDSLVTLIGRRQFARAQRLATDHPMNGGSRSVVTSAVKTPKGYLITAFALPAFGLMRGRKP